MGHLNLDIHVLARTIQAANNTSANGLKIMTGYQPNDPQYSNTVMLYVRNDRRVGINTLEPLADLHVDGTIMGTFLDIGDLIQRPRDPEIFVQNKDIDGIPVSTNAGDFWWDTSTQPPLLYVAAIAKADEIKAGEWEIGDENTEMFEELGFWDNYE